MQSMSNISAYDCLDASLYLYLPDTPNASRRILRGVRAKMVLIFSQNNQNITNKDALIT